MAKRTTDNEMVNRILDEMEGQKDQLKADKIVKALGKRIRQRYRDRDGEDFSQAAVRIVREATKD